MRDSAASRKFTDLIFDASTKYGNWDPPKKIEVGDFGLIDKDTGQFEKEGNIYSHPSVVAIAQAHPPEAHPVQDEMIITSVHVKRLDFSADPQVNIPGLAEAKIKGRWSFGNHRGALLIMDKPRIHSVPAVVLLRQLVDIPELKGRVLVTEATSCPAYSLYLSQRNNDSIDVALRGQVPVAATGVSLGGGLASAWWTSAASGVMHSGSESTYVYTPLYVAKKIKEKGWFKRESPRPPPKDDELWQEAYPPWDLLDSDGEEVPFEDTVYDDDDDDVPAKA